MSVSGLCGICEAGEAVGQCDRCGSLVCADHYDQSAGFCAECARDSGVGGGVRR